MWATRLPTFEVHLEQPRGEIRSVHDVQHNVCLAGGGSDILEHVQCSPACVYTILTHVSSILRFGISGNWICSYQAVLRQYVELMLC